MAGPSGPNVSKSRSPSTASACLVIVGRMRGIEGIEARLGAAGPQGVGEPSSADLSALAEGVGFRCRALRVPTDELPGLAAALPALVRLRDGRSHVLVAVEEHAGVFEATLIDPARSDVPLRLGRSAYERLTTDDVLLLARGSLAAPAAARLGWPTLRAMLGAERRLLGDLALASLILGVLALLPILAAQALLDDATTYHARDTFVFLSCGLAVLAVFEAGFAAVRRGLVARLSTRIRLRLDEAMFDRLLDWPVTTFETIPPGLIAHRVGRIGAIGRAVAVPLVSTALDAGIAVVFLPAMLHASVVLTVVAGALAGLALLVALLLMPRHARAAVALDAAEAEGAAFLVRGLAAARTIKVLALEGRQRRRWDALTARIARARLGESRVTGVVGTVGRLAERLAVFGCFALGAAFALHGETSLSRPALFAFLLMTWRVAAPLRHLGLIGSQWASARTAAAALFALADQPAEAGRHRAGSIVPLQGRIDVANVDFTYPDAAVPALHAVSFSVPAGTVLGIMGRSGAGKSTIARLLQRLHADYGGLIKIDGIDIREYDLDHLRRGVGVVGQDSPLFAGTIRDNLLVARPDAGIAAMESAVRLVGAEALIERLPRGYDTVLREGASPLSDGERQRLAIARAVVGDPNVLVLDEATAALDADSEARLFGNLRRIGAGRTVIVISQRLASLARADTILVLDRGEVQDMGRHQDLVERSDIYAGLWQRQTGRLDRLLADRRPSRGAHVV